ncbi:FAGL168Wp [Eremothecium gossypii FDAG1]|nr:FAGL168Wp [Eremothecium gossypii FDAG1]
MTTSHRPQLEARSGTKSGVAGEYVPTGVKHARLLPGHRTVKRRREGGATAEDEERERAGAETRTVDCNEGTDELAGEGRSAGSGDGDEASSAEDSSDADDEDDVDNPEELRRELEALRASKTGAKTGAKTGEKGAGGGGWRAGAVFGRQKRRREQAEGRAYRNDVTQSEYHQDFLRRLTK